MKNRIATKLFSVLAFVALLTGCKDHDIPDDVLVQEGLTLSGIQEVPANASAAIGSAVMKYNKTTRMLEYAITFNNLTGNPTAGHIHASAPRGENAGVLIPFDDLPKATSGVILGSAKIDADKEDDLLNGLFYINLHTAAHPGGEIRGQIEFYSQDFIVSKKGLSIDPAQAQQTQEPQAIGNMDVSYNKRTKRLSYHITWNNIPRLIGIGIGGPADKGTYGPDKVVIAFFDNSSGPFSNNRPLKALSGSMVVDESVLKESELLSNRYFVKFYNDTNRTSPTIPLSPIQGQIEF